MAPKGLPILPVDGNSEGSVDVSSEGSSTNAEINARNEMCDHVKEMKSEMDRAVAAADGKLISLEQFKEGTNCQNCKSLADIAAGHIRMCITRLQHFIDDCDEFPIEAQDEHSNLETFYTIICQDFDELTDYGWWVIDLSLIHI